MDALGSILKKGRDKEGNVSNKDKREILDALILGSMSLFSTRTSYESTYRVANCMEEELSGLKFRSGKGGPGGGRMERLREFTDSTEFAHLKNYNPTLFIFLVERMLQLIGQRMCFLVDELMEVDLYEGRSPPYIM